MKREDFEDRMDGKWGRDDALLEADRLARDTGEAHVAFTDSRGFSGVVPLSAWEAARSVEVLRLRDAAHVRTCNPPPVPEEGA